MLKLLNNSVIFILIALCSLDPCQAFSISLYGKASPIRRQSSSSVRGQQQQQQQQQHLVSNENIPEQDQDAVLDVWYKKHGIICPNVEVQTTKKSVGGRGLFWTGYSNNQDGENVNAEAAAAKQGDILAFIPHELVFEVSSNLRSEFAELDEMYNINERADNDTSPISWPAILTSYACKAHQKDAGTVWKDTIESWKGGAPTARPSESYTNEEINSLMELISIGDEDEGKNILTAEMTHEVIDKRYNTYKRDLDSVKMFIENEDTFGLLYGLILSRCASLGPQWQGSRGVIPLHDMLNHPPASNSNGSNIELFCVGDVRDMAGDERTSHLLSSLKASVIGKTIEGDDEVRIDNCSDKDVLLVASTNIDVGDELLLSYRNCSEKVEKDHQMWLLLQYGFPFW